WNAGHCIVLNTDSPTDSVVVGDHCYALVGYDPSNPLPFKVFNPWGKNPTGSASGFKDLGNGTFIANAAFLSRNFSSQSVTSAVFASVTSDVMQGNPTRTDETNQALPYAVATSNVTTPVPYEIFNSWGSNPTGSAPGFKDVGNGTFIANA